MSAEVSQLWLQLHGCTDGRILIGGFRQQATGVVVPVKHERERGGGVEKKDRGREGERGGERERGREEGREGERERENQTDRQSDRQRL